MNNRVVYGLTALLGCSEGCLRTEAGPEQRAAAVAEALPAPAPPGKGTVNGGGGAGSVEATAAPPQPVKGTVKGEPFEVKAALALHRWRGEEKNVELYDVPKTCAETTAASLAADAGINRTVNIVVPWKTGEHVVVEQRQHGFGGFMTYGPGSLTSVAPFDSLDVTVIDAGSASAPGRVRFRAAGAKSTLEGEVEVTVCPPSGGPPTDCLIDEDCADGSVCRRDRSGDRTKKTPNGTMGTFGASGRCVTSSPAP